MVKRNLKKFLLKIYRAGNVYPDFCVKRIIIDLILESKPFFEVMPEYDGERQTVILDPGLVQKAFWEIIQWGNDNTINVPEPLENHSIEIGKIGSLKSKSIPNSSVDLYSVDGKLLQRRFYGDDGRATVDVDFSHGNGDGTHTFPHIHNWDWTKSKPRQ